MNKYTILRTESADFQLKEQILYIADVFGVDTALQKLEEIEKQINLLSDNPELGVLPNEFALRKRGYRVLILKKNIVFYKIFKNKKQIIVYAMLDQRQDYIKIIKGL